MDNHTFRSRIVELIQKSRKAMRLYSSVGRGFSVGSEARINYGGDFTELQAEEWRGVNADLVKRLTALVEAPQQARLISDVVSFFEQIQEQFRQSESELNSKQRELIFSAESGDFVKAALLSRQLVAVKSRVQATQAAHHELESVLKRSRIEYPRMIELTTEMAEHNSTQDVEDNSDFSPSEDKAPKMAKVIPLRRVGI